MNNKCSDINKHVDFCTKKWSWLIAIMPFVVLFLELARLHQSYILYNIIMYGYKMKKWILIVMKSSSE